MLSDRRLLAKLVPTFADRECHVVSVMDSYGLILGFLDQHIHTTWCYIPKDDNVHYYISFVGDIQALTLLLYTNKLYRMVQWKRKGKGAFLCE
jgi:hypothetical protein